jgi:hypothetical protein
VGIKQGFPDPPSTAADFTTVDDINLIFPVSGEGAADPAVNAPGGKIDFAGGGQDITRQGLSHAEAMVEALGIPFPEEHPDPEALRPKYFRGAARANMPQFDGDFFFHATSEPPDKLFPAFFDRFRIVDNL